MEDTINVYEFLRQMRSKRVFMVQTVVSVLHVLLHIQYMFLMYMYTVVSCIKMCVGNLCDSWV